MKNLLLLLAVFLCKEMVAQSNVSDIAKIKLTSIEGKNYVLETSEKPCVIIFLSPGCPLSQKYTLTINELAKEFGGSVKFYGVFAEANPDVSEYRDFQKKYNIGFALLIDKSKNLVKALTANVTPEAFVLNKGKVVYHGAIDDWVIALGKTKKSATTNFVRNAINCIMANTTPVPAYSKPIGCFID